MSVSIPKNPSLFMEELIMVKTASNIARRLAAVLLALIMAVGMLPAAAQAAGSDLPDWYFLFAVFTKVDADCADKDGAVKRIKYTMTQDEIDFAKDNAKTFEEYMNSLGVMRAHVDVVEINAAVTELQKSTADTPSGTNGSFIGSEQAAPLLKDAGIDLDEYDHVTCITSLDASMGYLAITGSEFENGTGEACMNFKSREYLKRMGYLKMHVSSQDLTYLESAYAHELLHFMERLNKKWGKEFDLHKIWENYYSGKETQCYTDLLLNQFRKNAEFGTGVEPVSWKYPPRVLRITPIPEGVTAIGDHEFWQRTYLEKVTIPSSVISIGYAAFGECPALAEVTILDGVADIGDYGFYGCANLKSIAIPQSVTEIGYAAFWNTGLTDVYYGGSQAQWGAIQKGEYNSALTNANIHYDSSMPAPEPTPAPTVFTDVPDWCAGAASWAADNGIAQGYGDGIFGPDDPCPGSQIITMLWNAAGKPAAKAASPFTVISYSQEAVDWAYGENIIDDSFRPDDICTRATAMQFTWKAFGSPDAADSSFSDVPAGADYAPALDWAVDVGIAEGIGGNRFSPDTPCTRGDIVTLLRRAYVPEVRLKPVQAAAVPAAG